MNSYLVFAVLAVIATVAAADNCNVMKCLSGMSDLDPQDKNSACPIMDNAIKCMENVINTCAALGDSKASVQGPLDQAKQQFSKTCAGYGAAGFIQPQSLLILLPVAIISAIYSRL